MWRQIEPRNYSRSINCVPLLQALCCGYLLRVPGLRGLVKLAPRAVGTMNFSSLSPAMRRGSFCRLAGALVDRLGAQSRPRKDQLVALDSMPLTLPRTYRHGCDRINRHTVGGGVLWALTLSAARRATPAVRVLKIIAGPWHDSKLMADVRLMPEGPIYLMDRGFYAIGRLCEWLDQGVRFIVRAKQARIRFKVLRACGAPRVLPGGKRIIHDAVVRLGGPQRRRRPRVRLVWAVLPTGENLILVSSQLRRGAESLLADYRKRWQIERFHFFLKETIGLAHLYSFQKNGIAFVLHAAVLLAMLMYCQARAKAGRLTVDIMREVLQAWREALLIFGQWRPNTVRKGQTRHRKKKRNL